VYPFQVGFHFIERKYALIPFRRDEKKAIFSHELSAVNA
jgi:hypothetical protein